MTENAEIYDEILKMRIFAPVQPDRTTILRRGEQYGAHLRSFCRVFSNKIIMPGMDMLTGGHAGR